jgi:hypothetical protein
MPATRHPSNTLEVRPATPPGNEHTPAPVDSESLPILEEAGPVLAADDLVTEYVDVPEWGYRLRLRSLTGTERDALEVAAIRMREAGLDPLVNLRARLVAAHARKADGTTRVFTTEQVTALGRKSAAPLGRLYDVCTRISGFDEAEVEKAMDTLGKAPSDASGTA